MSLKHVHAVIVGAGGGVAAKVLADGDLSVVVLERGGWVSAFDCRKDDLRNQRTSVLGHPFGPDDERNPRVAVDPDGATRLVRPSEAGCQNNAACVGSGTVSYGAMAWRYMERDFKMRSTYGAVPGSTLEDWPINYADLEPYYEKVEWEMGVSGDVSPDPFKGPRKRGLWGWVLGIFTLSYSLFEIPSGAMGDRFGPRRTLARIVLWWSAFTTITGFVGGFRSLLAVRFLFGTGEAGAYPNSSGVIARWFPVAERARAHGIVWMAGLLGAGITPIVVVPIQARYGWRASFLCFGILGVVWAGAWYWWFRDTPAQMTGVSAAELAEIGPAPARTHIPLPWRAVLRTRNFWAILLSYFCYCAGSNFYLTWLHTYLQRGRGMTEAEMAVASTFPFLLGAAANLFAGWLSDVLVRRRGLRFGRRSVGASGLAAGGAFLLAAALSPHNGAAVVFLTLAYCGMVSVLAPAWAICLDVGREWAGSLTGAMNTAGQLGAFTSTVGFGYIVSSFGSYSLPLFPLAGVLLLGAWLFSRIDPCERIAAGPGAAHAAEMSSQFA